MPAVVLDNKVKEQGTHSYKLRTFVPAVMFEMVQQDSFLMLFLWLVMSRLSRLCRAPQLMMTCEGPRARQWDQLMLQLLLALILPLELSVVQLQLSLVQKAETRHVKMSGP